mmetsp:Transcript_3557/g.22354  ORF Transcript_3557/g.22354 Transcript_3557/m.22354 type:complete len:236 (+) Transcript_3557:2076-2783(+)
MADVSHGHCTPCRCCLSLRMLNAICPTRIRWIPSGPRIADERSFFCLQFCFPSVFVMLSSTLFRLLQMKTPIKFSTTIVCLILSAVCSRLSFDLFYSTSCMGIVYSNPSKDFTSHCYEPISSQICLIVALGCRLGRPILFSIIIILQALLGQNNDIAIATVTLEIHLHIFCFLVSLHERGWCQAILSVCRGHVTDTFMLLAIDRDVELPGRWKCARDNPIIGAVNSTLCCLLSPH